MIQVRTPTAPGSCRISIAGLSAACTGRWRGACRSQTDRWLLQGHHDPLLPQSTDFNSFVEEVRASLERHHLGWRPIDYLFSSDLPDGAHLKAVHPSCGGDYMVGACTLCCPLGCDQVESQHGLLAQEFGVYEAGSTNKTARWRRRNCHASCPPVFGFDTFSVRPIRSDNACLPGKDLAALCLCMQCCNRCLVCLAVLGMLMPSLLQHGCMLGTCMQSGLC